METDMIILLVIGIIITISSILALVINIKSSKRLKQHIKDNPEWIRDNIYEYAQESTGIEVLAVVLIITLLFGLCCVFLPLLQIIY